MNFILISNFYRTQSCFVSLQSGMGNMRGVARTGADWRGLARTGADWSNFWNIVLQHHLVVILGTNNPLSVENITISWKINHSAHFAHGQNARSGKSLSVFQNVDFLCHLVIILSGMEWTNDQDILLQHHLVVF